MQRTPPVVTSAVEADRIYRLICDSLRSLFELNCLDQQAETVLRATENLLTEHYERPDSSKLKQMIPEIGLFYTPLHLVQAFQIYNTKYRITRRRYIPPTAHEVRHILNIAQVVASRAFLQLVSFDGDETLYPHGLNLDDTQAATYLVSLLKIGVSVALVTAAGYSYQTEKYEARLRGLLRLFKKEELPHSVVKNFYVFGGECNYLLRCGADYHLEPVPEETWLHMSSVANKTEEIKQLLDVAEEVLTHAQEELCLRVKLVRKERAIGSIPGGAQGRKDMPLGSGGESLKAEILEEIVYRIKDAIYSRGPKIPFCAFNGGRDVWVDAGNKAEGLKILQQFLGLKPRNCLHIGDQFSPSGNDVSTRNCSPTIWVCNPSETKAILRALLRQLKITGRSEQGSPPDLILPEIALSPVPDIDMVQAVTDYEDDPSPYMATSPPHSPRALTYKQGANSDSDS